MIRLKCNDKLTCMTWLHAHTTMCSALRSIDKIVTHTSTIVFVIVVVQVSHSWMYECVFEKWKLFETKLKMKLEFLVYRLNRISYRTILSFSFNIQFTLVFRRCSACEDVIKQNIYTIKLRKNNIRLFHYF